MFWCKLLLISAKCRQYLVQTVCTVQEQYKYCFKVLWDYSKYKKAKDETSNCQKRPTRPGSPQSTDVRQTPGRSFTTALNTQNMETGRKPPLSEFEEIELSNTHLK